MHGSPTSMALDAHNSFTLKEVEVFADLIKDKLREDGTLILHSCCTAKKVKSGINIATAFSKYLPKRTIWAPTDPTYGTHLNFDENGKVNASFFLYKSRLRIIGELFLNLILLNPNKPLSNKIDITACIKNSN